MNFFLFISKKENRFVFKKFLANLVYRSYVNSFKSFSIFDNDGRYKSTNPFASKSEASSGVTVSASLTGSL